MDNVLPINPPQYLARLHVTYEKRGESPNAVSVLHRIRRLGATKRKDR